MARKEIKIDTQGKYKCVNCDKWLDETKYYKYAHHLYKAIGFLPICKTCVANEFDRLLEIHNSERTALYELCAELNIPFYFKAYEGAAVTAQKKNMKVYSAYFSKMNSFGEANGYGTTFHEGELLDKDLSMKNDTIKLTYDENYKDINIDIIKYWGKGKQVWEYEFLEEEIYKIKTSFECPDYGMEMIMRDICFINLDIEKTRLNSSDFKTDTNKLIETRSKLMNDAKMKPIQATGAESNDQITFGTLIKKLENDRPTDEPLDEWKDPDNFAKWHTIFIGHLADMNDIDNDAVREYKEIIKPYTVTRDEENGE